MTAAGAKNRLEHGKGDNDISLKAHKDSQTSVARKYSHSAQDHNTIVVHRPPVITIPARLDLRAGSRKQPDSSPETCTLSAVKLTATVSGDSPTGDCFPGSSTNDLSAGRADAQKDVIAVASTPASSVTMTLFFSQPQNSSIHDSTSTTTTATITPLTTPPSCLRSSASDGMPYYSVFEPPVPGGEDFLDRLPMVFDQPEDSAIDNKNEPHNDLKPKPKCDTLQQSGLNTSAIPAVVSAGNAISHNKAVSKNAGASPIQQGMEAWANPESVNSNHCCESWCCCCFCCTSTPKTTPTPKP